MRIDVFTLFPEAFGWFERQRHVANALASGHRLEYVNYRDHTPLNGGQVDDTPFGGGAGMVLRVDVVEAALRARYGRDPVALRGERRVIVLAPGGRLLDDALVDELAGRATRSRCFRAGTRASTRGSSITSRPTRCRSAATCSPAASWRRWSCATRSCASSPGSLGHPESAREESFSQALAGAPEYPHYTRPAEYRGWQVPDVLLSGHHARIKEWRLAQSAARRAGCSDGPLP